MFFEKKFLISINPQFESPQTIKFGKNMELTLDPKKISDSIYNVYLKNQNGDFNVVKILEKGVFIYKPFVTSVELLFDEKLKMFYFKYDPTVFSGRRTFEFEILANIEYKEVNYIKDIYHLFYSSERLKMLEEYEFEKMEFVLPKYQDLKFTCYFKKHEENVVEVHIVNPYNLKIEGKKGDFKYETTDRNDINFKLSFIFDPSTVYNKEKFDTADSRPESVMHEFTNNSQY